MTLITRIYIQTKHLCFSLFVSSSITLERTSSSMKTQLHSHLFTKLFLSLLILLINTIMATSNSVTPTTDNPFDFIRLSCNATLYPDVCFTSLSRYANAIQREPLHLALFAIGVSLSRTRRASTYFSNLTHKADYGPSPKAASALRDCCSTFNDAIDQMRGSLKEMRQLRQGATKTRDEEVRFRLSDVQTWMSAALTNEGTCSDGFADVADCPVKDGVTHRVDDVTKLTSNALALVNSLVNSVGS